MSTQTAKRRVIRTTTMARVRLTVDVSVGSWGPECKIDQVYQQASEEAINRVRRLINDHGAKVVGLVEVEAITTALEERERARG